VGAGLTFGQRIVVCMKCEQHSKPIKGKCACRANGKDISDNARNGCPLDLFPTPVRGLGDVVAKVTKAVGIKPCGGCKERQKKLNELVPFTRP
jgi:hypothetical protein